MGKRHARAIAAAVHRRANGERRTQGHDALDGTLALAQPAEAYARTLAHSDTLGHEVDGTTPGDRCEGFVGVRENVARVPARDRPAATAADAIERWLASPTHRRTLLASGVAHSGVGVWLRHGDAYIVHDVASRRRLDRGLAKAFGRLTG